MKTLNDYVAEGIFDDNANKELSSLKIVELLSGVQYNTTDGSKDCLGQPLKEGDAIIVADKSLKLGVYIKKAGMRVVYYSVDWYRTINKYASGFLKSGTMKDDIQDIKEQTNCNKVVKIDLKNIKL